MNKVVIGIANENLESDIRSLLDELQNIEVVAIALDTNQLTDYVARFNPILVLLDESLGPEPTHSVIRDLSENNPATAIVQISAERSSNIIIRALESGARGVVSYPFTFEDFAARIRDALDWAARMRQVLTGAAASYSGRGRVLTLVGAKGGVGVTTLAVHIAVDHLENNPTEKVCVLDLDLEKGDVTALIDVRHSVSVADLASVHQDLSASTVKDAVTEHETGIHLLLTPTDVRQTELVTPDALRAIVTLLRREFDLVVVDAGGYVSPAQAAAIELANETLVVITPDVFAIRALRKRILAWEALGIVHETELRILLNKTDKSAIFPADAVTKLTTGQVLTTRIPLSFRALEPGVNERDPRSIIDPNWWRLITRVRQELGLGNADVQAAKPKRRSRRREAGAIALENAGILPLLLILVVILWQAAVVGLGSFWLAQASSEVTRVYAISGDANQALIAGKKTIPATFANQLSVSTSGSKVRVSIQLPTSLVLDEVSSEHIVVEEP